MASRMEPADAFINFIIGIGLREEDAHNLWGGNIKSPQELAACDKEKLCGIVDNAVLLKHIHPVLQKFTFPITIASDPYDKALSLLRSEANKNEGSAPQNCRQGTQSDAIGTIYTSDWGNPGSSPMETNMEVNVGNATRTIKEREVRGNEMSVKISGGTFVQSAIMPQKEVRYDNQNSKFLINAVNGSPKLPKIFRTLDVNDFFVSNPVYNEKFTVEGMQVQTTINGQTTVDRDAYPIHNWGQSRALILNNTRFDGNSPERLGAATDSKNLKALLEQLGFKVDLHMNKRKQEIMQILKEFTGSRDNQHAPMVFVFIGSHGQREGNVDWFVGTDNERISDEQVAKLFTPSEASLIKKETPKLFFFQFCRQNKQTGTQSDSIVEMEEPRTYGWTEGSTQSDAGPDPGPQGTGSNPAHKWANMLFAHATAPGTKAFRDTNEGSWFVSILCKALKENYRKEDLLSILTKVNAAVMLKKGSENGNDVVQMSEVKSYLTKKVKFV